MAAVLRAQIANPLPPRSARETLSCTASRSRSLVWASRSRTTLVRTPMGLARTRPFDRVVQQDVAIAHGWRWPDFRNARGRRCAGRIGTREMSYRREDNPSVSNNRPEGPAPETLEREKAWRRGASPAEERKVPEFLCSSLVECVREYAIFPLDTDGIIQLWGESARLMKWWTKEQ